MRGSKNVRNLHDVIYGWPLTGQKGERRRGLNEGREKGEDKNACCLGSPMKGRSQKKMGSVIELNAEPSIQCGLIARFRSLLGHTVNWVSEFNSSQVGTSKLGATLMCP